MLWFVLRWWRRYREGAHSEKVLLLRRPAERLALRVRWKVLGWWLVSGRWEVVPQKWFYGDGDGSESLPWWAPVSEVVRLNGGWVGRFWV